MERNRPRIRPRTFGEWMTRDSCIREKFVDGLWTRLASLRELQSETQEELDALLPSVLDRAFKGEL
jgi:hypothetical protein